MISIIIPTYNEEVFLPKLFSDLKKQTFSDFEIIVADAHSKDETRNIAIEAGAKVVDGGKPAAGRNAGARVARGDYLIFFDADVSIASNFLEKAFKEFQQKYYEMATCDYVPDIDDNTISMLLDLYDSYARSVQFIRPSCGGAFIFMTKRLFDRLGGFDESLGLGEDHDIARRAKKIAQFAILDSVSITFSTRRMKKEGVWQFMSKNLQSEMLQLFTGKVEEGQIEYEFGTFDKKEQEREKSEFQKNFQRFKKRLQAFKRKSSDNFK